MHCAKCIIRSNLWMNIDDTQERAVPSLATALVDHGKLDITYQELDDMIRDDEKTNLY